MTKTPYVVLDEMLELLACLGAHHIKAQLIPNDGLIGMHAINVWANPEDRFPSTTVYPPENADDFWTWGHSFELKLLSGFSPVMVSQKIKDTKDAWTRT